MIATTPLRAVLHDDFLPQNLKCRSDKSVHQYNVTIRQFELFLGMPATVAELRDDVLIRFMRWMLVARRLAPATANDRLGRVKTLWIWLAKRGEMATWPTVQRVPEPEHNPHAWSVEELRGMLAAAGKMRGTVGRVAAADWWPALLVWLWNTGERKTATLSMLWEHVNLGKRVASLPAGIRKQGLKSATYPLWPETCERLKRIRQAERVFHFDRTDAIYYRRYDQLLWLAGLPTGRDRKTHSLRVSHATWLAVNGGDATRSLMHSDPNITRESYIDRTYAQPPMPDLPSIFGED